MATKVFKSHNDVSKFPGIRISEVVKVVPAISIDKFDYDQMRSNVTRLESALATSRQRTAKLEEKLRPFAEAYKTIPKGLRSTLRIWDGEDGIIHLTISTDTLEQAATALTPGESEGEGK